MAKLTPQQRFASWYNRRAGANAGGSTPRHNNEGLMVDEFGDTILDHNNRPIELPVATDQSQDELLHAWVSSAAYDWSDEADVLGALTFDGVAWEQYRNDGLNFINRLCLSLIDGEIPRIDINQEFLLSKDSRLEILMRLVELPLGSPMIGSPVVINEELSLTAYTRDLNGLPLEGEPQGAAILESGGPGDVWTYTMQKAQFSNPMHGAHGMHRVGTQFLDAPYVADGLVDVCLDIRSIKLYDRAL